jgi:hypothetical protein
VKDDVRLWRISMGYIGSPRSLLMGPSGPSRSGPDGDAACPPRHHHGVIDGLRVHGPDRRRFPVAVLAAALVLLRFFPFFLFTVALGVVFTSGR